MADTYWVDSSGDFLVDGNGDYYFCDVCPCDEITVIDCNSVDTTVPGDGSTVTVDITNTVLAGGCDDASEMDGSYVIPWVEAEHWRLAPHLDTSCTTSGFDDYNMDVFVLCVSNTIYIEMGWGHNNFGANTVTYRYTQAPGGTISGQYTLGTRVTGGNITSMTVKVTF